MIAFYNLWVKYKFVLGKDMNYNQLIMIILAYLTLRNN